MIVLVCYVLWIFVHTRCWVTGLDCGYPGAPAFGRPHPVKELYRPGDAVYFNCAHGYSQQGPLQRICQSNGTWAPGILPLCDHSLSNLDQQASSRMTLSLYPANKSIDGDPNSCAYTDKLRPRWIRVDLRDNHRVKAVALTVPQGIYSQDPAQLTIYAISVRDSTTASYHKCASFSGRFAAATLRLTCAGGEVEGRYIHVEDNRHRVDYFSLCEIQVYANKGHYECGEVERPAHSYSVRTETGAAHYRCVYGYRLEGPDTRICMTNGQWSLYQPICREIVCPSIGGIKNGRIQYLGRKAELLTLGTILNVTCDYGYRISGSPLICREDETWSPGNLSCEPIDCGIPTVRYNSEQYVLLNGTLYGSTALLKCGELEETIVCREDGTWSYPEIDCAPDNRLSRLGLIDEEQNEVPTDIVIGMATAVFILLLIVILVLLIKRRKVLKQNSTDSFPSKDSNSTLTQNSPQPYEADSFYATIPVDNNIDNPIETKKNIMSTILFIRKKSDGKKSEENKDSGNSSISNCCIYEEIENQAETNKALSEIDEEKYQPVYAQVDLDEKRRSRLNRSLCDRFEPVDPPQWENTYRSEASPSYDEVDLEPIKLRELPPIPDESGNEGGTYASLSIPLDPPVSNNIYQNSSYLHDDNTTVLKDNELYSGNITVKHHSDPMPATQLKK